VESGGGHCPGLGGHLYSARTTLHSFAGYAAGEVYDKVYDKVSELSKTSSRMEKLAQVEFPFPPFLRRELRRELPLNH
jgi:hypothetical protein